MATISTRRHLFGVPIDRSEEPVRLSPEPSGAMEVQSFELSADGLRVVFLYGQSDLGLNSALLDGSSPTVLLQAGFGTSGDYELSADSTRITFARAGNAYSVPIDGSEAPVRLNPLLGPGESVHKLRVSPDSTRAIYLANQESGGARLYGVAIVGSQAEFELSGALVPGGQIHIGWQISADGVWVVYQADQETNDLQEVFSVRADGSEARRKLSAPAGAQLTTLSPDGRFVLFVDAATGSLFTRAIDASRPAQQFYDDELLGGSSYFYWSDNGSRLAIGADPENDGVFELYGVPLDGSRAPVLLSQPLAAGESVLIGPGAVHFLPHSRRVVYRTHQVGNVDELFLSQWLVDRMSHVRPSL